MIQYTLIRYGLKDSYLFTIVIHVSINQVYIQNTTRTFLSFLF